MAIWKFESLQVWEFGNLKIWKFEIWKFWTVKIWYLKNWNMKLLEIKIGNLKTLEVCKFSEILKLKRNDNKLILEVLNFGNFAKYIIWWWNILGNWLSENFWKSLNIKCEKLKILGIW